MIDGTDVGVAEQFREDPFHDLARGEHVRNAARDAKVVFQDHELAVGKTDQVGTHHRDIDISGGNDATHLTAEMFAAINHFARHDAVSQTTAFVVDIAQKHVESSDALRQAPLDDVPLGAGNNAGQKVVREDAFGTLVASINSKGDALM